MNKTAIAAPKILVDGDWLTDHCVLVGGQRIVRICPTESVPDAIAIEHFNDGYLVPGFFDIQVNGGGGVLFNDDPSLASLEAITTAHRRFGTTAMLPTLISDDLEKITAAIEAVDTAITQGMPGIAGIHLEGPFLNAERKGIHDARKFRRLNEDHIVLLSSLKNGKTLVTLAPELTNPTLIRALAGAGIILSAGHTNATYEETLSAVDAGVSGFTHLYNAMSPFQSRAPGVVGAAFDTKATWAGLIADGFHVHPAALRHAIKTKGIEKSILVTDAMPTVGSDTKDFWLGDQHIVAKDGRCTNKEGVLAGSDLDMATAVRTIVHQVGFELKDAVCMASHSPATFMTLSHEYGTLTPGKRANLVLLTSQLETAATWIDGIKH